MLDTPPMRRVQQAREVARLGLAGLNIQPSFFGLPIDDRSLYPLYTAAAEEDLVVFVHTGVNYTAHRPISNDHPLQLDQVACDFPGLRLVACHGGWPFVPEMVAVARKHPQVFLDFGGLAPRYVGRPGTGWDALFAVMGSLLSRQVLFATDWPVFPMERALREWSELALPDATRALLLHGNVTRLLDGAT
jgi:predicted TIM-barrel fold metal-dependent hydrolase